MSASTCDTIYIGDVTECAVLVADKNLIFDFETPATSLPQNTKQIYVILTGLSPEQLQRRPDVCAVIKKHLPTAQLQCRTVKQLQEAAARAAYAATHDTSSFIGIQLPLEEQILPCAVWNGDLSGKFTRDWYHNLLNFALRKERVTKLICVIHGPSGIGKTLAITRIKQILERDARPEKLLSISACSVTPSNCETLMLDMITHARGINNILVLDDFDAGVPERMLRLFETLACRRIVICNDPYAKSNQALRKKTHYFLEVVNRVHAPSLLAYLERHFPQPDTPEALRKQRLEQIVESAQGDARVALTDARWASLLAGKMTTNKDFCRVGEIPSAAILRCSRARDVVDACYKTFGEGDVYTPAELLFENHTNYNPSDLEAAAAIVELQSFGDTYDRAQQDSLREGSDAHITDKRLHFELAFALPCQLLSKVTKHKPSAKSEMRFRSWTLQDRTKKNGGALRNIVMRRHMAENELPLEMRLRQLADQLPDELLGLTTAGENLDGSHTYQALTFGDVCGRRLISALGAVKITRGQSEEEKVAAQTLRIAMRQFAASGKTAEDFLYFCQRHIAMTIPSMHAESVELRLPPAKQIEEIFERVTGKSANVLGDAGDDAGGDEVEEKKDDGDDGDDKDAQSQRPVKKRRSEPRPVSEGAKKIKKSGVQVDKKKSSGLLDALFKKQASKTKSLCAQ